MQTPSPRGRAPSVTLERSVAPDGSVDEVQGQFERMASHAKKLNGQIIFLRQAFLADGKPVLVVVYKRLAWFTVRLIRNDPRGAVTVENVKRVTNEAEAMEIAAC